MNFTFQKWPRSHISKVGLTRKLITLLLEQGLVASGCDLDGDFLGPTEVEPREKLPGSTGHFYRF